MTAQQIAERASLLADRSRAAMCLALLDGRAWTAGELAAVAAVAPSTASEHIAVLTAGGAVKRIRQGRHAYVILTDPTLADLLEDLRDPPAPAIGLRQVRVAARLAAARTCYDHLAGDLGVAVYDSLVDHGLLVDSGLTDAGREWFETRLGAAALASRRRPLIRHCLDWTRRVPHLGGALGATLTGYLFSNGWVYRSPSDRTVTVSVAGVDGLTGLFGPALRPAAIAACAPREHPSVVPETILS